MEAIRNILRDILLQFQTKGALVKRLSLVIRYYFYYICFRFKGLSQGESQLNSYKQLASKGVLSEIVRICPRGGRIMKIDLLAAWVLVKEILFEDMYFRIESYRPQKGQTVIDVGAHQGVYTLEVAELVGEGGTVISIEASPHNFALLKNNLALNSVAWAKPIHAAVLNFSGHTTLHVSRLVSGWNSTVVANDSDDVEVPAETLDAILHKLGVEKPDLVKIDVEGACYNVLVGAPNTLASKPRLVMEIEGGEEEINKVWEYLTARGYTLERFGCILYAESR